MAPTRGVGDGEPEEPPLSKTLGISAEPADLVRVPAQGHDDLAAVRPLGDVVGHEPSGHTSCASASPAPAAVSSRWVSVYK